MQSSVALPSPLDLKVSLFEALGHRRACRSYSADPLDLPTLATILWATAGQSDAKGHRTAPSALDIREIDAYVLDAKGVWRYNSPTHALACIRGVDVRGETTRSQAFVTIAPVTVCLCADLAKTGSLPPEKAPYVIRLDAGAMMQNGILAATALGLSSVVRGVPNPASLSTAMGLPDNILPVICFTVGFPGSEV